MRYRARAKITLRPAAPGWSARAVRGIPDSSRSMPASAQTVCPLPRRVAAFAGARRLYEV